MDELRSFDTGIGENRLFVGMPDSLEDFLVYEHHLLSMDESARIDKDMSNNSSRTSILLEDKSEYAILCEHLSIREGIPSDHSDRMLISVEGIKGELERVPDDMLLRECENLTRDYMSIDTSSEAVRIPFCQE